MSTQSVTPQNINNDAVGTKITQLKLRRKADGSLEAYEPPSTPEELLAKETAKLLEECSEFVRRYVVVKPEQSTVLAAWALHTWAIDAFDSTPYLHITAPEKQCGKSVLLRTIQALVRQPLKSGGMSAAALVRTIHAKRPALLLDEMDALTKGDKELGEAFRGVLNCGFERGTPYIRLEGKSFEVKEFDVFCPKALAGIGQVWDTVADRSIVIELRRKSPHERVESSRERFIRDAAAPLRAALESWASSGVIEALRVARPAMPNSWADRQQDISEPLVAIAEMGGVDSSKSIKDALTKLFGSGAASDESIGVTLLRDIRTAFGDLEKITSADLSERLREMEGQPWADWAHGKGLDANRLAKQLKKYDIAPHQIKFPGGDNYRGYDRADFADAWERYAPAKATISGPLSATPATTPINIGDSANLLPATEVLPNVSTRYPLPATEGEIWVPVAGESEIYPLPATYPLPADPHKQRVVAGVAGVAAPRGYDPKRDGLFDEVSL